jgi:hypothetical protein
LIVRATVAHHAVAVIHHLAIRFIVRIMPRPLIEPEGV